MMKGQLPGLMKQAQQMQENLKKAQEELAMMEVEGQSGAGMVKVVMTGRHDVKRVTHRPEPAERRQGHARGPDRRRRERRRAPRRDRHPGKDGRLTSGLGLPPGMKLPF